MLSNKELLSHFTEVIVYGLVIPAIVGVAIISLLRVGTVVYPMEIRNEFQTLSECVLEDQYGSLCWSGIEPPEITTIYSDKSDNKYEYCHLILPMCTAQMQSTVDLNSTLRLIENKVGETKHDELKTWEVKITSEGMYASTKEVIIHKKGATIIFTPEKTTFNGAEVTFGELSVKGIKIPALDWQEFLVVSFIQE